MSKVRRVIVTGSAGNLGQKAVAALNALDHVKVVGIDRDGRGIHDVVRADLERYDAEWAAFFHGAETVLHLAGDPDQFQDQKRVQRTHIDLTRNVFRASEEGRVRRLVFASSNWILAGYRFRPERLSPSLSPLPVNPYGEAKLSLEREGLALAARTRMSFLALRIGCCLKGENRPGPHMPFGRWGQEMWLGDEDWAQATIKAVIPPLEATGVLNVVSRNEGMLWDLDAGRRLIGYDPVQQSTPILRPSVRLKEIAVRFRDVMVSPGRAKPPFGAFW